MLTKEQGLYIAHCENGPISLTGKMANRHGLIAGATGTGKTVSLQVMAETFSQAGVPCFMADMKGDLSGISQAGAMSGFIEKRLPEFGIENPEFQPCPVRFYDIYGEQGHPIRATISQMGPEMLARLMDLNETQTGVLNIVFRVADERGLLLLDIKDLRSMLSYCAKNAEALRIKYGHITSPSVGAIQRELLRLEDQGGNEFFGEPSFDIYDFLQVEGGKGIMSVLAADKLMHQPKLYSTFLLWLISEMYVQLPEVGDLELPKLVFFFDEAHMLFDGTSRALIEKIEQVVRLIRSKGVGIYFVTQSPSDIPDIILGQLGNRVQHALRAFTPKDQKAVRTAADTFRANPAFKTDEAIMNLETGEALVSVLDEKGAPTVVERCKMLFPLSQIGAISESQRDNIIKASRLYGKYDKMVDRESAFEVLLEQSEKEQKELERIKAEKEAAKEAAKAEKEAEKEAAKAEKEAEKEKKKPGILKKVWKAIVTAVTATFATIVGAFVTEKVTGKKSKSSKSATERITKNATTAATRTITRELGRSILGNLIK